MRTRIINSIRTTREALHEARGQDDVVQRIVGEIEIPSLDFCEREIRDGTDIFRLLSALATAFGRVLSAIIAGWRATHKSRFDMSATVVGQVADTCVRHCRSHAETRPTSPSSSSKH